VVNASNSLGYDTLKTAIWAFIDSFNGRAEFSMGDARAYLSMLTDIGVLERGLDYVSALASALKHAEEVRRARGFPGIIEDYRATYSKWLESPREKLKDKALRVPVYKYTANISTDSELAVISLFTGAFGLDLRFEMAGFRVVAALDISEESYKNLKANRPKIPFLLGDIKKFSTKDILREAGVKPGEVDVVTGGPPCQPFSPAGKRQSLGDPRAAPLMEFIRVVKRGKSSTRPTMELPRRGSV
jgi:hypothetical protein